MIATILGDYMEAIHHGDIPPPAHLCYKGVMTDTPSRLDKFTQAARELETGDDPQRYKERLRRLMRHDPVEMSA